MGGEGVPASPGQHFSVVTALFPRRPAQVSEPFGSSDEPVDLAGLLWVETSNEFLLRCLSHTVVLSEQLSTSEKARPSQAVSDILDFGPGDSSASDHCRESDFLGRAGSQPSPPGGKVRLGDGLGTTPWHQPTQGALMNPIEAS